MVARILTHFGPVLIACVALGGCQTASVPSGPSPSLAQEWRDTAPAPDAGCFAKREEPSALETVTSQVLVTPEVRDPETGKITTPAQYRQETRHQLVPGRGTIWFPTLCAAELTPDLVSALQRSLMARGLYSGAVTGTINAETSKAVRAYQRPRGLDSATLSTRAAQQMGLIVWTDAGT